MAEERTSAFPVPLTSLIGRERDIATASALLNEEGVRLVTLTGPGGVGKTRLAIAVAGRLAAETGRRSVFVDLSPVGHPELVLLAIAQQLDVRDVGEESLEARVTSALGASPTLLVLDNFEHLVEAAPLAPRLLVVCPSVRILVTSRERLRVSGEHDVEVPPLGLPDGPSVHSPEELLGVEAVRLFVERARAVDRGFALTASNVADVARICEQLEGLPLAIELAAARVKAFPPEELHRRLQSSLSLLSGGGRDRPARHKTMREALAWSYALLSAEEQRVYRQLAVFSGGCTLEAAEAVCARGDVIEPLMSLIDKSLVLGETARSGNARFRMLEPVRQFGLEQLKTAEEEYGARCRHAAYYLALAEGKDPAIPVSGDFAWITRLTPDNENLRSALSWLAANHEDRSLIQLAVALTGYWLVRGFHDEGRHWLTLALQRNGDGPVELRAAAIQALGTFAYFRGAYDESWDHYSMQLDLLGRESTGFPTALAYHSLGSVAYRRGQFGQATDLLLEALAMFEELASTAPAAPPMAGYVLALLGDTALTQGQLDRAAAWCERSLERARAANYSWLLIDVLGGLGVVHVMRKDMAAAEARYLEALDYGLTGANDMPHLASALTGLAVVAMKRGQLERGVRLLGAADALRERLGAVVYPRDRAMLDQALAEARGELGGDQFAALHAMGRTLTVEQVRDEAQAIRTTDARAGASATRGQSVPFGLTSRELDILRLIVDGLSDSEIAERLFISRRTVTTHTSNIFRKLGVSGRAEAAAVAIRRGLT
jgi:non-specific serine/threonine protein kinase